MGRKNRLLSAAVFPAYMVPSPASGLTAAALG